jgi:hypothetical protein
MIGFRRLLACFDGWAAPSDMSFKAPPRPGKEVFPRGHDISAARQLVDDRPAKVYDQKPTNPKDAMGSAKAPLGLVPDTIVVEVAMAYMEGALKYGRYNWRISGVRASIYNDALDRHRMKWWNGQDADPVTKVKHLANMIACCGILLDAELCGMLKDDRPPAAPMDVLIDSKQEHIAYLKELFKDHSPRHFTIADKPGAV